MLYGYAKSNNKYFTHYIQIKLNVLQKANIKKYTKQIFLMFVH